MNELKRFCCTTCNFFAASNYCLERHFATKKHVKNVHLPDLNTETKYRCEGCNKNYKGPSGIWQHAKVCKYVALIPESAEETVKNGSINIQESAINKVLEELRKMNELSINQDIEMKKMNELSLNQDIEMKKMNKIIADLKENQQQPKQTIHNNINNNIFNMTVFLNEKCNNAIDLNDFIKNLKYELSDKKLLIDSYVEGTCDIIQRNLNVLPMNERPLHYLVGEDPHQQLMHIRNGDKWNIGTQLNWMQQIHADDDDDVVDKNPIYYALQKIDAEKLNYLAYYCNQDKEYMMQHGRLHRETSRPDFKEKVYQRVLEMVTFDRSKL